MNKRTTQVRNVIKRVQKVRQWLITDADQAEYSDRVAIAISGMLLSLCGMIIAAILYLFKDHTELLHDSYIVYIMAAAAFGVYLARDSNRWQISLVGMLILCVSIGMIMAKFPDMMGIIFVAFVCLQGLWVAGSVWPGAHKKIYIMFFVALTFGAVGWQTTEDFLEVAGFDETKHGLLVGAPIIGLVVADFIYTFSWFSGQPNTKDACFDTVVHLLIGVLNVAGKMKKFALGGNVRKDKSLSFGVTAIDLNDYSDTWRAEVNQLHYHIDIVLLTIDGWVVQVATRDITETLYYLPDELQLSKAEDFKGGFHVFDVEESVSLGHLAIELGKIPGHRVDWSVVTS